MRAAVLTAILVLTATPAMADGAGRAQAEAYLAVDDCFSTQSAANAPFTNEEPARALPALAQAQAACRDAAAKLSKARFDDVDTTLAAEGLDEMVKGLGRMEDGIRLQETSTGEGKRETKLGYLTYRQGLQKLKRAAR